jgi:formate hydrogenlyase subunit 3/multisubunit Na+/H+ antiporter MnhD subunit
MPGSLIVFLTPLIGGAVAYVLRRWRTLELVAAGVTCALMFGLLTSPAAAGFLGIDLNGRLDLLGRSLQISPALRLPLILLTVCAFALLLASWRTPENWAYIPVGLIMLAIVCAALMIRPFQYAGMSFVIIGALGALMIQADRSGDGSTAGARRYLIVNALALPMFLGAGYMADRAATVSDPSLVAAAYLPAALLAVIGIGLVAGALPLFTWIHPIAQDAPPLTTAFMMTIGVGAAGFLLISMLAELAWLRNATDARTLIDIGGAASLAIAAALAWAQRSLARIYACGALATLGSALLAINLWSPQGVEAASFAVLARMLSLGVFGIGMALLRERCQSDEFDDIRGAGSREPWLTLAVGVGGLSMAGLPGTIGFVASWAVARSISANAEMIALIAVAGISIAIGVIRALGALFDGVSHPTTVLADQERSERWTVGIGVMLTLVLGLFPSLLSGMIADIARAVRF